MAASGELWRHVVATLTRVGAGFAIGALAGTMLGAVAPRRAITFATRQTRSQLSPVECFVSTRGRSPVGSIIMILGMVIRTAAEAVARSSCILATI